jgi:hypothetical protein
MNIKQGFPPNIKAIKKAFPFDANTVFTYGDDLYIQDHEEKEVLPHLLVHEGVHTVQQGTDPDAWWDKYIADPQFRLEQEIEAYRAQYSFLKSHIITKGHKKVLFKLASDLSSPQYGNLVTHIEAENLIRK